MKRLSVPGRKGIRRMTINKFRGADFSTYSGDVDVSRSPDIQNMISDRNGQPVKRFGYEKIAQYEGRVNGLFTLHGGSTEHRLAHVGTKMILRGETAADDKVLSTAMNDERSVAFQMDGRLWVLDGKGYYVFNGTTWRSVANSDDAYIPTTAIACAPGTSPGGETYEPANLLSKWRTNTYYVPDGNTSKVFMLDFKPLDADAVKAWIMDGNGNWVAKTEGTHFTVNRTTGTVTFTTAPGKSNGEDSVKITAAKTVSGYADRIGKCTVQTLFGLSSYNQAFVTGNPEHINYHYYSYPDKPGYFPDTNYAVVGQDNTRIMGYRKSGQYLVIIKENNYQDATAFLMNGELSTQEKTSINYYIKQGIAGVGAVSKYCFCDLQDDHLFLSKDGVFAVTTNAVTAEKYAQTRSALINRRLVRQNLAEAVGTVHEGYFYIAVDGVCYVADAAQKHYDGKGTEQYQYEWYYWTGMPVRVWGADGDRLVFGTPDGAIMRMYTEKASESYQDDGRAISARWTTPMMDFSYGDLYKTIRYLFTRLQPFARSSVRIYIRTDGAWSLLDSRNVDIFTFLDMSFKRFSFNTNSENLTLATTVKEKKVITTQFKFENDAWKEGFGLQSVVMQFLDKNRIK